MDQLIFIIGSAHLKVTSRTSATTLKATIRVERRATSLQNSIRLEATTT